MQLGPKKVFSINGGRGQIKALWIELLVLERNNSKRGSDVSGSGSWNSYSIVWHHCLKLRKWPWMPPSGVAWCSYCIFCEERNILACTGCTCWTQNYCTACFFREYIGSSSWSDQVSTKTTRIFTTTEAAMLQRGCSKIMARSAQSASRFRSNQENCRWTLLVEKKRMCMIKHAA